MTASTRLVLGAWYDRVMARYLRFCLMTPTRRDASSAEIWPSHWKGVCALGTNTLTEMPRRRLPRWSGGVAAFMTS